MKLNYWLLFYLSMLPVSYGQQSISGEKPEGCSKETFFGNPNLGAVHKLANGNKLHFCGYKSKSGSYGHLFLEKLGSLPTETNINLGGTSEAYGPFNTDLIEYEFTKSGMKVIDLIPFDESQYIKAVGREIFCVREKCSERNRKCLFRKQKGSIDKDAYQRLNSYFKSKEITIPLAKDVMHVYQNALRGHKPSRSILLSAMLKKKIDEAMENTGDNSEGAAHHVIKLTLEKLVKAKCF